MFYMSGTPKPFFDNGKFGISEHHGYIQATINESGTLIWYLKTKLIKMLIKESSTAQAWNKNFLKLLSAIDLTHNWTDEELYRHFQLTQDEIDYIESTVK
jgi:site-specific DNA-methyltransferase (adenine-specific)